MSETESNGGQSPGEALIASAKETRALLLSALAALAFSSVSTLALRDCELLTESGKIKLPVLAVEVPVRTFFLVLPFLLFLVFVYTYQQLERMAERAKIREGEKLPVWPLSELPFPHGGPGRVVSVITQLVVWFAWPIVAAQCALSVVSLSDASLSAVNVVAAFVALGTSFWYWLKVKPLKAAWRAGKRKWQDTRKARQDEHQAGQDERKARLHVRAYVRNAWLHVAKALWELAPLIVVAGCSAWVGTVDHWSLPDHFTDFRQADISSLDLDGRNLANADFRGATLEYVHLCGARIEGSLFRGAKARKSVFVCRHDGFEKLSNLDFSDSDLTLVDFSQTKLVHDVLFGANLTDTTFWRSTLGNAGAPKPGKESAKTEKRCPEGDHADLSHSVLTRANLSEVKANGANLIEATGTAPNFYRAHLECAHFGLASFDNPNFTGAHLKNADFSRARIQKALLRGADLTDADLRGCDLTGADFDASTKFDGASCNRFTKASDELKARLGGCKGD